MKKCIVILYAFILASCGVPLGEGDLPENRELPEYPEIIWYTPGSRPVDFDLGMENINRYIEDKLRVRLDMRMLPWQEMNEKSLQIVNSGEAFDIMFIDSVNYNTFVTLGAFYDITDVVRSVAADLWEVIPDLVWSGVKIGGRIYSVPTYKDIALAQFLVFDKELADKSGIDVSALETWEDLDTALTKIKSVNGDGFYPVVLSRNDTFSGVLNGFDSFGSGLPVISVRTDDPYRRVICILEDETFVNRLEMLRKWYLNGIINPDANMIFENTVPRRFFSAVGWPGAEAIWQRNEGVEAYVSKRIFGPVLSSETIQGSLNAISSNSTKKRESLKLLEQINLDPVLRDMFAYGVEGVHFEYVGDGVVRRLNNNWNVPVFSQATFFTMSATDEGPANQWELLREQNNMAEASVMLGFSMDISELSTELSACRAIWDKYKIDFLTGASDLDTEISQCLDELRAAGMDILISEAQKQINIFTANGGFGS